VPRDNVIDPSVVHHQWDADLEPILAIDSGDTVRYDVKVAGDGQVWPGAKYEDVHFDFDTICNLSGPVWINGAWTLWWIRRKHLASISLAVDV
jgi:acetamidase/formamidase